MQRKVKSIKRAIAGQYKDVSMKGKRNETPVKNIDSGGRDDS